MPLPRIAIVGRPNVGKSSLLNRLARRRVSIVDAAPGVTRDRVSTMIELQPPLQSPRGTPERLAELIDTGGWGVYTAEGKQFDDIGSDLSALTPGIESQILTAMLSAEIILMVVDAQSGLTSLDRTIASMLRERGCGERIVMVANKVDDQSWIPGAAEAASLGFGPPAAVSAETGFGVRALLDALYERCGMFESDAAPAAEEMKIAIVGKRNAGKSTLINALAGEDRVIVSEIAGTTRDSIDVRFEIEGRTMLAIDTAGVRKRKSFADDVEYYAWTRMIGSIRRADVVMLLIDATEPIAQVDKKLADELGRQFKPTVIVINKWDAVESRGVEPDDYLEHVTGQLRRFDFAPIVCISANTGEGVRDAVAMAFNLFEQASHRETTGRLNTAVRKILEKRGPSSRLGTQAKVLYVSQVAVNPPTIAIVVNDPKLFRGQYERYLMNELREVLPYSEVPFRLLFRKRQRMELDEMKQRGRSASRKDAKAQRGLGERVGLKRATRR